MTIPKGFYHYIVLPLAIFISESMPLTSNILLLQVCLKMWSHEPNKKQVWNICLERRVAKGIKLTDLCNHPNHKVEWSKELSHLREFMNWDLKMWWTGPLPYAFQNWQLLNWIDTASVHVYTHRQVLLSAINIEPPTPCSKHE